MNTLDTFIDTHSDWKFVPTDKAADKQEKIIRIYPMDNFLTGLDLVNDIAAMAEEAGHHPSIQLSYGHVVVELWTHDSDEVTQKDIDLATQIEELYSYVSA